LNSWQLHITPAVFTSGIQNGHRMDQNGNAIQAESTDVFAVPDPVNGTPFVLPYAAGSQPISISGPYVSATRLAGQPATSYNQALSASVSSIDVGFDRVMNSSTFTPADILRITGPLGDISMSGVTVVPITALNGTPLANPLTNSQFFRVSFKTQSLSGYYQLQLGSNIADTAGNLVDTNNNAGIGKLFGAFVGAPVTNQSYGGSAINVNLNPHSTATIPLSVADAYSLLSARVTVTINFPTTRDLTGRLVAPDGSSVLLFTKAPATGAQANMINTTFDDAATTPVQLGGSQFANASFNPIQPLAQLNGHSSLGTWDLVIQNNGNSAGTITQFQLQLNKQEVGTGMGETVADQTSLSFNIFQSNGSTVALSNWTPAGPAGEGTTNAPDPNTATNQTSGTGSADTVGRVESIAIDPSDPSGNTVYAAGASGGVWRTTNFMTRDIDGPTWVPLTDFGPNNAINVGSIALYPDANGDPLKTTILVGTGSQDADRIQQQQMLGNEPMTFDGVGFLLSNDAGKTWQVLDSSNNFNTSTGQYLPISDTGRDHMFVGADVNSIVYEPKVNPANNLPIAYATVGQGTDPTANVAGLYRSMDGGRSWTLLYQGNVDDFVLAAGSELPNSLGRPTIAYMAVEGVGMFRTVQLNGPTPTFTAMAGGVGRPTVDAEAHGLPTNGPADTPNGAKGKIVIAVPSVVPNNPLANNYYQRWVYALVSNADGTFNGLYESKDAGDNWTLVVAPPNNPPVPSFFTDFAGNNSLALTIDPNNPNIVYMGSNEVIRVDTTFSNDPYNFSMYQYSNPDGGAIRGSTTGGVTATSPNNVGGGLYAYDAATGTFAFTPGINEIAGAVQNPAATWNFINLARDPYNPFRTDTPLDTVNFFEGYYADVANFNNTGADTVLQAPNDSRVPDGFGGFVDTTQGAGLFEWVSNMTTFVDPLTGVGRLVFASDQGVGTYVTNSDGSFTEVDGFFQPGANLQGGVNTQVADGANAVWDTNLETYGMRNGNLQVARLYSGDVQPSLLAASISQSLLIAAGRQFPDAPASTADILSPNLAVNPTENTIWGSVGRTDTTNYVQTDDTGTGAVYILRRADETITRQDGSLNPAVNTANMFQVQFDGGTPISRTEGLFDLGFAQWNNSVSRFAVNSIDPLGIVMGSAQGRLYRTTNQGLNWFSIGEPSVFDGTYLSALDFGAPQPSQPNQPPPALSDYIYAGTKGGKIFVTTKGGGAAANWKDISAGLDGSTVQQIVANPTRGSNEAYAVTSTGVFWMADWNATGATWVNLTNNLPKIMTLGFGNTNWSNTLLPAAAATNPQLLSLAVDWRPTYSPSPGLPILYVGGDGGVFEAVRNTAIPPTGPNQTAWVRYPDMTAQKAASPGGGLPVVKVTALSLSVGNIDPNTGRAINDAAPGILVATTLGRGDWVIGLGQPAGVSGPHVTAFTPSTPQVNAVTDLTVTFNEYIDPTSFTTADVTVTDPSGNPVTIQDVQDITPIVPNQPDLHNQWEIDFVNPFTGVGTPQTGDGTYNVSIGPGVTDGSGTPMDQNLNGVNGEIPGDIFKTTFVIGANDLTDFVIDTYDKLLGRDPTTTEYNSKNVTSMDTARTAALQTVIKTLLGTYNSVAGQPANVGEARQRLVERLVDNGGAPNEVGNLLPGFTLATADRDAFALALYQGKSSPETIARDLIATTDTTKPWYNYYFVTKSSSNVDTFLQNIYTDLYPGLGINPITMLSPTTLTAQRTQAGTPQGRFNLVNSLVKGATVTYYPAGYPNGKTTTDFRTNDVKLLYAKYLPGYVPTAADISSARSLMGKPLASKSLQGSEWVLWKIMTSKQYFNSKVQGDGLPDDGLHTDRSWIAGVISDRMYRPAVTTEKDTFSQSILDLFKNQRATFVTAVTNTTEYRGDQITKYYQLVFGPTRLVASTEMSTWQSKLAAGTTYASLVGTLLGSIEYFNDNSNPNDTNTQRTHEWAQAVYQTLLGRAALPSEETTLVNKALSSGRVTAALTIVNGNEFRDKVITQWFNLLLNRAPTANELLAYEAFLKANDRWQLIPVDMLGKGTAAIPGKPPTPVALGLPREFWEIKN
jgi:large repetitive protein